MFHTLAFYLWIGLPLGVATPGWLPPSLWASALKPGLPGWFPPYVIGSPASMLTGIFLRKVYKVIYMNLCYVDWFVLPILITE